LALAGCVDYLAIRGKNDVIDVGEWSEIELSNIGVGNGILEDAPVVRFRETCQIEGQGGSHSLGGVNSEKRNKKFARKLGIESAD
jgi:hypothetical protein